MSGWEITLELQAFARVECLVQYRVRGTFRNRDEWTVDDVAIPGQAGQHDWISITRLHPLWSAYEEYSHTPAFDRDVDQAIAAEMDGDYEEAA